MKQLLSVLLVLVTLIALAGCSPEEELIIPESEIGLPELWVVCGDIKTQASLGTYIWNYPVPHDAAEQEESNENSGGVCRDAIHPLERQRFLTRVDVSADHVVLDFSQAPDSFRVECWSDDDWGNTSAESIEIAPEGYSFQLLPEGHIYAITARWDGRGEAEYCVYIVSGE